jgi:hypothetical protein
VAGHRHDGCGIRAGYRGSAVDASLLGVFGVDETSLSNGLEIERANLDRADEFVRSVPQRCPFAGIVKVCAT